MTDYDGTYPKYVQSMMTDIQNMSKTLPNMTKRKQKSKSWFIETFKKISIASRKRANVSILLSFGHKVNMFRIRIQHKVT